MLPRNESRTFVVPGAGVTLQREEEGSIESSIRGLLLSKPSLRSALLEDIDPPAYLCSASSAVIRLCRRCAGALILLASTRCFPFGAWLARLQRPAAKPPPGYLATVKLYSCATSTPALPSSPAIDSSFLHLEGSRPPARHAPSPVWRPRSFDSRLHRLGPIMHSCSTQ